MLELFIVLALILLNAFFALSEMSVVTSRKARLKQRAESSKSAQKALDLAEHPERFLSSVQVGITLIGILTGMFGGDAIGQKIGRWLAEHAPSMGQYANTIGTVIAVTLITYFSIVLGELLPKRLALLAPERLACAVAIPMHWLSKIAGPAIWLLSTTVHGILKLFGIRQNGDGKVTEEEIQLLLSEGHEQGVLDLDERNMMNRVMRLGDRTADSLMTPRKRIIWLDIASPFEDNMATLMEGEFSRYPVYRDNDSDVLGVLEVKSLLDEFGKPQPNLFQDLRPALFVSESTHATKLLEILREEQQSQALVVDEYGDIQGLVTLTDIVDAVIGRLQAFGEFDNDEALVVEREDGSLLVDGGLRVEELRELTSERFADADELEYRTAAGMVMAHFGRIPHVGEHFRVGAWRIEVVDLDGPRIDKLLLQRHVASTAAVEGDG